VSFILEALRRADRERKTGTNPDLQTVVELAPGPPAQHRWAWFGVAAVGLLGAVALGVVLWPQTGTRAPTAVSVVSPPPAPEPALTTPTRTTPVTSAVVPAVVPVMPTPAPPPVTKPPIANPPAPARTDTGTVADPVRPTPPASRPSVTPASVVAPSPTPTTVTLPSDPAMPSVSFRWACMN
jgi:hypothetical protein